MTAATFDAPAGRELAGRFTDVRVLHTGSRFTVYEGRERDGRLVAIKVPEATRAGWISDALRAEGELLTRYRSHRHIVTLRQTIDLPDGRPALVLDRCREILPEAGHERMPLQQALSIGIKLAGALETVHEDGVLHCDVRPANVLLTEDGEPVLSGFDEAFSTRASAPRFPQHVITVHTAPELLEGADPVPASDVYGLAATLYELLAGQPPFRQYAGESAATVIVRVLSGQVVPIVAPDVPLEVSDLLTWAMAGDPAKRPPGPAWLAEELDRLEARQGWPRTRRVGG